MPRRPGNCSLLAVWRLEKLGFGAALEGLTSGMRMWYSSDDRGSMSGPVVVDAG